MTTSSSVAGRTVRFVGIVQEVYRRSRQKDIGEESARFDGRSRRTAAVRLRGRDLRRGGDPPHRTGRPHAADGRERGLPGDAVGGCPRVRAGPDGPAPRRRPAAQRRNEVRRARRHRPRLPARQERRSPERQRHRRPRHEIHAAADRQLAAAPRGPAAERGDAERPAASASGPDRIQRQELRPVLHRPLEHAISSRTRSDQPRRLAGDGRGRSAAVRESRSSSPRSRKDLATPVATGPHRATT